MQFNITSRCCPERKGNIKEVLTYICKKYLDNVYKGNSTPEDVNLINNGLILEEFNNFWVNCERTKENLIKNPCFSYYFVNDKNAPDTCGNQHIKYCYNAKIHKCENETKA